MVNWHILDGVEMELFCAIEKAGLDLLKPVGTDWEREMNEYLIREFGDFCLPVDKVWPRFESAAADIEEALRKSVAVREMERVELTSHSSIDQPRRRQRTASGFVGYLPMQLGLMSFNIMVHPDIPGYDNSLQVGNDVGMNGGGSDTTEEEFTNYESSSIDGDLTARLTAEVFAGLAFERSSRGIIQGADCR
ncbi:hypothetical protein BJ508DRAFT_314936 [Ascobolus immersus RN42]|uniref:Uncharacterized protein n=1 Tax=Ascobolus immersus RN42 TaxID=1160509 RepID=A0A3N4HRB1_ASCIM|nr:hypothetical protein BJ508DRAFT_314936 [Ascobolus immersus RN42]